MGAAQAQPGRGVSAHAARGTVGCDPVTVAHFEVLTSAAGALVLQRLLGPGQRLNTDVRPGFEKAIAVYGNTTLLENPQQALPALRQAAQP